MITVLVDLAGTKDCCLKQTNKNYLTQVFLTCPEGREPLFEICEDLLNDVKIML